MLALEPATTENGCMWAARGGQKVPLKSRFHKQDEEMLMNALSDVALADCTTLLEANTDTLAVSHGLLPRLSYEN